VNEKSKYMRSVNYNNSIDMNQIKGLILLLCCVALASQQAVSIDLPGADFCWKNSYFRGFGRIPTECAPGKDRIGLLCYPPCPSGYERFGFDCRQKCPSPFTDQGAFCRITEYGRGAGYPWKFGDGLNNNGMFSRC